MALILDSLGKFDKAMETLQRAIEIRGKVLCEDHPITVHATTYQCSHGLGWPRSFRRGSLDATRNLGDIAEGIG